MLGVPSTHSKTMSEFVKGEFETGGTDTVSCSHRQLAIERRCSKDCFTLGISHCVDSRL
uniref:Uncharacterized protein n=1 Tax=Anguilla anguilla TaxID=7936 RepID=A0A0E9RKZ3_ANGAN